MALNTLNSTEKRIIGALLDRIEQEVSKQENMTVEICGEDTLDYKGRFDRARIEEVIGDTDMTRIRLRGDNIRCWVLLIHGEFEDVIADCGGNTRGFEFANRIVDDVLRAEDLA